MARAMHCLHRLHQLRHRRIISLSVFVHHHACATNKIAIADRHLVRMCSRDLGGIGNGDRAGRRPARLNQSGSNTLH